MTIISGIAGTSLENANLYEELDKNITLFNTVLQDISYGIWVVSRSGLLLLSNRRMCQLLSKREEELLGLPFLDLLPKSLYGQLEGAIEKTWENGMARMEFDFPLEEDCEIPSGSGLKGY